jgi:VIT1/CCC1 family predicted Fe2+/Mn2+ transporter
MAAGEYVSVSSQHDAEQADLKREAKELAADPQAEAAELASLYVARGLDPALAREVASQLMAKDALGAHARDELGLSDATAAKPMQAAGASAAAFAAGAVPPLLIALVSPVSATVPAVALSSLVVLALLGGLGAQFGGAPMTPAILRVTFWGAVAMVVTAGLGRLFGAVV